MLQRLVALDHALLVLLEGPGGLVVLLFGRIEAGEQAVLEGELLANEKARIGVVQHVVGEVELLVQDVLAQAAHEGDVRSGTKRHVESAA